MSADGDGERRLAAGEGPDDVRTFAVSPHRRFNVWVDMIHELSNADVSAVLRSTNGVPIVVERPMWWGDGGGW